MHIHVAKFIIIFSFQNQVNNVIMCLSLFVQNGGGHSLRFFRMIEMEDSQRSTLVLQNVDNSLVEFVSHLPAADAVYHKPV